MVKIDKQKLKERMLKKARKSFELEGIYFTDEQINNVPRDLSLRNKRQKNRQGVS